MKPELTLEGLPILQKSETEEFFKNLKRSATPERDMIQTVRSWSSELERENPIYFSICLEAANEFKKKSERDAAFKIIDLGVIMYKMLKEQGLKFEPPVKIPTLEGALTKSIDKHLPRNQEGMRQMTENAMSELQRENPFLYKSLGTMMSRYLDNPLLQYRAEVVITFLYTVLKEHGKKQRDSVGK